jgi:hypothetical protein
MVVALGSWKPSTFEPPTAKFLSPHQVQAMVHLDIDPGSTTGKMLEPNEMVVSGASQVDRKSAQRFEYEANNLIRLS